jgi:hexulose-6-phosphate isomerase
VLKGVYHRLLPSDLSYAERFRMAARAGFQAVEMPTLSDACEAEAVRDAARETGVRIGSVAATLGRQPAYLVGAGVDIEQAVKAVHQSIENAAFWGADTVLLIPGIIDSATSYEDAYACSQAALRERLLPFATAQNVRIGIENVWYGFLLTPPEYVRYIDECESPFLGAYVDVGNMIFGYPQHWVRAAGKRIVGVHLKDFRMDRWGGRSSFEALGDGSADLPALRQAFRDAGYDGSFVTAEVEAPPLLRHSERAHGSRYRRLWPSPAQGLLASYRQSARASFLHDLSRRFDHFYSLP